MERMSRREFLKVTAIASFFLLTGSCGIYEKLDDLINTSQKRKREDPNSELVNSIKSLLKNYETVSNKGVEFYNRFGVFPPIFDKVLEALTELSSYIQNQTTKNTLSSQLQLKAGGNTKEWINFLNDDWGENIKNSVKAAGEYVNRITINPSDESRKDVESKKARDFLHKVAKVFPVLILALPETISILPPGSGGAASCNGTQITSFSDEETAMFILLHEANHQLDLKLSTPPSCNICKDFSPNQDPDPNKIKQYIKRENLANYIVTYWECIIKIVNKFLDLTEDNATEYHHLLEINNLTPELRENKKFLSAFWKVINSYTNKFNLSCDYSHIPSSQIEIEYAYTTFVHRLGNKLMNSSSPNKSPINPEILEEMRSIFRNGFPLTDFGVEFCGLLPGVAHYLTDFPEFSGKATIIASGDNQIKDKVFNDEVLKMLQSRLNNFSTLSSSSLSELRKALGLREEYLPQLPKE